MSTKAKGDAFEQRTLLAIKRELNAERLGILPHSCEVFARKGYFSRDRNAEIIVDISIEIRLPNAKDWSLLWICECKDYQGSLPVDDVEEFHSKLQQIAGDNIKGVMVVSGALQKSALEYAKSKGIGIVRILPNEQVQWVISYSRRFDATEFMRALTTPDFQGNNREFYATADGYIFDGWFSYAEKVIRENLKSTRQLAPMKYPNPMHE